MPNVSASFRASSVAAIVVALVTLTPTAGSAQGHGDHLMVAPTDLKWADVPSLPPGVKIAVIEGPMNEAKPFTMRLRLPADDQIPAHSHSAIEHVTVISATFTGAGLPILDAGPRVPYAEPQLYCAPGRIWRGSRSSCSSWCRPDSTLVLCGRRVRFLRSVERAHQYARDEFLDR